jgi:hypothetical protein
MLQRYHVGTIIHMHDGVQRFWLHWYRNQTNPKDPHSSPCLLPFLLFFKRPLELMDRDSK